MRTLQVWKFPLRVAVATSFDMPVGAKVLHVGRQRDLPCIWALVDPSAPKEIRRFLLVGTGHDIDLADGFDLVHVGILQTSDERFVVHVFECAR